MLPYSVQNDIQNLYEDQESEFDIQPISGSEIEDYDIEDEFKEESSKSEEQQQPIKKSSQW
jgi:hypothetical protein